MNRVRNRLAALFFVITAAAIGFVYLYVVPQLRSSLTDEKLERLEEVGTDESSRLAAALRRGASRFELRALVRDVARQVQTNQKRVEASRAARSLAERRLEAEEKKFAAGIQTTFFVFQAQRDLAQARSNFLRTAVDYAKSVVDLEAVQQAPLQVPAPR